MARAKEDLMDLLHATTAEQLSTILKDGIIMVDKDGVQVRIPAPASYIAAAIKFLKDNNITAEPGSPRFGDLKNAIGEIPVFDDDDEFNSQRPN